jgi:hypothetical protein
MVSTRVAADWAWISKDPQAGIGYSVLATSRGDTDFGPFIGRYVPGTPSSTVPSDAPDAPPWITFGPAVVQSAEALMTVTVREPWRERDHAGRPVWPQKLLVMRFAELAEAGASYQTISDVAFRTKIPAPERATLRLEIAEQPLDELIRTIKVYGFEQLAALAAALLEGPVVVAGAGYLDRGERLAVLDAVVALLPYGFRARLSVSSVVDNTSKHDIRLTFADFAHDGQRLIPLDTPAGPRTELGQRYLDMLGKKESAPGLDVLIKYLWNAKAPCSFTEPGKAVAVVLDLDFYGAFRREASHGPIPLIMLRKFLADPAAAERVWDGFDVRIRDNALASYLPARDTEAAKAVITRWSFLGNDVIRLINDRLDQEALDLALWCLQTAGPVEDRLLGDLLVPSQKVRQQRAMTLVELLVRLDPPQPDEFRYTCDQLRYDEATAWQACLVRDLLIRELAKDRPAGRGRAWAWVRWLCESEFTARKWRRPDWVTALDAVVFDPPPQPSVPSVRSLVLADAGWAIVLLRLAGQSKCLRDLLDITHRQFVELAGRIPGPSKPGSVGAQLGLELNRDLWALDVQPGAVASIDVARVLLGGHPRDFPAELPPKLLGGYFDGLAAAFSLDVAQARLADLEESFLRRAVPGEPPGELTAGGAGLLNAWAADPRLRADLHAYIARLEPAAYPYHPDLSSAFWDALRQHPALAGHAAAHQLISTVQEARRDPGTALQRPLAEDAVKSTPLARACFNARRAGLPVAGMIRALARGQADAIGAEPLDDVLREFQELLRHDYLTRRAAGRDAEDSAEKDLLECYQLITAGALGEPFADDFRRHLADRLHGEIQVCQLVLAEILPAATPSRQRKLSWLSRRS